MFETVFKASKKGARNGNKPVKSQDTSGKSSSKKRRRPPKKKQEDGKRPKKNPPTEQALSLSRQLKEFSSQKRLQDALDLYWDSSNDSIRDEHHACIVVDCCSRCGDSGEGEKIVTHLKESGADINVQTKTALLKGYVHSGLMEKATELYKEMKKMKHRRDRPNVRTLNTLLRGCLWTASTVTNTNSSSKNTHSVYGGIITSEEIWPSEKCKDIIPDSSSYEYSITLLCQAFRCDEAVSRILAMRNAFEMKSEKTDQGEQFTAPDPSLLETLAVSFLSLSRAYAMLGKFAQAKRFAKSALDAVESFSQSQKHGDGQVVEEINSKQRGGKRAWKSHDDTQSNSRESDQLSRRAVSNSLFRAHKMTELQHEAKIILHVCANQSQNKSLMFFLATRLLYFSGGGTTDLSFSREDNVNSESYNIESESLRVLNSTWLSFGLSSITSSSRSKLKLPSSENVLKEHHYKEVMKTINGWQASPLDHEGFLDMKNVFLIDNDVSDASSDPQFSGKRPLHLEMGSGFGEWVVSQARANPSSDYIAVELRSDRVGQMFSKAMLNGGNVPLTNLCSIGSECGSFLKSRVRNGTLSTVFCNHPEPPTQTFGAHAINLNNVAKGGVEPAHMLNSDTLFSASKCLDSRDGRLVIITDNRWYANLICFTLIKLLRSHPGLLHSAQLGGKSGIELVDTFHHEANERVLLFEGQPCNLIGHFVEKNESNGSSYFDRLWRLGAGTHAEQKKRFIICMTRCKGAGGDSVQRTKRKSTTSRLPGNKPKNKKKNAAKQMRRNQKRLLKKAAAGT